MAKRALITGITGQDGSYLAELLLSKGYEVHGLIRRASTFNTSRIDHLYVDPHTPNARLFLHYGDLSDGARLVTLLAEIDPDEVYNLAAQSHVRVSFDEPEHTADTTGTGTIRLLEAVRLSGIETRFYQASSSELYGATPPPQNEDTPFYPRSPVRGREAVQLLDHQELPRGLRHVRGQRHPVQPRITPPRRDVRHPQDHPRGRRDQGRHAGPRLHGQPGRRPRLGVRRRVRRGHVADAAGRRARRLRPGHRRGITVRDFLEIAFEHAGLNWEDHVRFDERYLRPTEVDALDRRRVARPHDKLGWVPTVDGRELARLMVDADIEALEHAGSPWIDKVGWTRGRTAVAEQLTMTTEVQFSPAELDRGATFYVAGHRGLVGSAICAQT